MKDVVGLQEKPNMVPFKHKNYEHPAPQRTNPSDLITSKS